MPAPKKLTKRIEPKVIWSPLEASQWSGIEYRTLLKLLKEGLVPTIPIGRSHTHTVGKGKYRRRRACSKYLIPRVAFVRWLESLGAPDPNSIGKTAA